MTGGIQTSILSPVWLTYDRILFPPFCCDLRSVHESNKVFVGGLRESEDAVHITEEELATYFSKFGVIESVSINRDDRTHRGRGFAFVKFFQEVRMLRIVNGLCG